MRKNMLLCLLAGLLLTCGANPVVAEEIDMTAFSVYVGGHYTDFNDYAKKIGEYNLITDDPYPELGLTLKRFKSGQAYFFDGHYYDKYNHNADLKVNLSDRFKFKADYQGMVHNEGQNLLEFMETREYLPTTGANGGKILTHELLDPGADYYENRYEVNTEAELLISRKGNIKLIAAHRSLIEHGKEQKLSTDHCYSCHVTSESAMIEQAMHEFETGFEAEAAGIDFGYLFAYRTFSSDAEETLADYDVAMHPGAGVGPDSVYYYEFGSRQLFSDTSLTIGTYPDTKKMSHKVRAGGDLGSGKIVGSITYATTENQDIAFIGDNLKTNSFGASVNYAVLLNPKTRLIAKAKMTRVESSDPYIDLPIFRDGRSGPNIDFDYIRYSSLDRRTFDFSAEIINRLTKRLTLSFLGGMDYNLHNDYPDLASETKTHKMIGQLKVKYRQGLDFTLQGKYRYEKTDEPFTNYRGLFEAEGREALQVTLPGPVAFYYQREDLKHQNITTEPTDYHEIEVKARFTPEPKWGMNASFKVISDKNTDLDSLDVKHLSVQPGLGLTYMPDMRWALAAGYNYNYYKSRGPVTVALFDG